ncbi:MAG TPA: histidine phosphatase family protein [Burkholderiales bacterium]
MPEVYLVRHAQASFGSDDYDRLSELGHRQSRWLGEYFAGRGLAFDRVITGSMRRHRETLEGIAQALKDLPTAAVMPGLNEYHADALLDAHAEATGTPRLDRKADRRTHFRLLREVLHAWVDGTLAGGAHPSFTAFSAGVREGLAAACARGAERVLVVSSGGPISTALCQVLGAEPGTMVELNLQTRNSGISELRATSRAVACMSFNTVPHLDLPERREFITHA